MAGTAREVDRLIRMLQRDPHLCTVRRTRTGHYVVSRAGCSPVTVSVSPSDRRWLANTKADIRRNFGIAL